MKLLRNSNIMNRSYLAPLHAMAELPCLAETGEHSSFPRARLAAMVGLPTSRLPQRFQLFALEGCIQPGSRPVHSHSVEGQFLTGGRRQQTDDGARVADQISAMWAAGLKAYSVAYSELGCHRKTPWRASGLNPEARGLAALVSRCYLLILLNRGFYFLKKPFENGSSAVVSKLE